MLAPLRINERPLGDTKLLELSGHLVFDDEGDQILRERVHALVDAGSRRILLDLHDVTYVDSGGIGAVVEMYPARGESRRPAGVDAARAVRAARAPDHASRLGAGRVRRRGNRDPRHPRAADALSRSDADGRVTSVSSLDAAGLRAPRSDPGRPSPCWQVRRCRSPSPAPRRAGH